MKNEIKFYCRKCKMGKSGKAPVEVAVNINGVRTFLPTSFKANPDSFKAHKEMAIEKYCEEIRRKIDDYQYDMLKQGVELTTENIKDFLKRGCTIRETTIDDVFTEYLDMIRNKVGVDMDINTYKRYEKAIAEFYANSGLTKDTPIKSVRNEHIVKFKINLAKRLQDSSSCGILTRIKTIFIFAFQNGKINSNPFYGIKINKGEKDTIEYLLPEELEKLTNKEIKNLRLDCVRDIFLFSCYTGLAYCDIKALDPTDFQQDKNGVYFIDKRRAKTDVRFYTILLPAALQIAKKHNFNFHVISNQKFNAYLKEIADICGIEKNLHFHCARHTACAIFLNQRPALPLGTIMRVFGWQSESMVKRYATILNTTMTEDIAKAFNLQMIKSAGYSVEEKEEINPNDTLVEKSKNINGKFKLKIVD